MLAARGGIVFPRLVVDTAKIEQNTRVVVGMCAEHGVSVVGVTKACGGAPQVAEAMLRGGVAGLADSRVDNLERLLHIDAEKMLVRSPLHCDMDRAVKAAQLSLNSEPATLRAIDEACERQGVEEHGVILAYDLGDLREGFTNRNELMECAEAAQSLKHVRVRGIGANLNCLSFIQPDTEKLSELVDAAREMQRRFGIDNITVSGGNSATIHMMLHEGLPEGINQLRLGESLLLGRERAHYAYLPGTSNESFIFEAEILELKDKPSKPWGTVGPDSYGVIHEFEDTGMQRRALVAFGHLDADLDVMWPTDPQVKAVASSSDHSVLDLTECDRDYQVGDTVQLRCGYHAAAHAFASPYVEKVYV